MSAAFFKHSILNSPCEHPRGRNRALMAADIVDSMVALPGQFLYRPQTPIALCFIEKNEPGGKCRAASELVLAA